MGVVVVIIRISCLVNTKNQVEEDNTSVKFITVSIFKEELVCRTSFLFTYLIIKMELLCKENIR